jgi:DNA polymerase III epsilon subunit-like protein
MITFFDTETTGLVKKGHTWDAHYRDFPRIVSIAWQNYFDKPMQLYHYILNPEGYLIPGEAIAIHGITNEEANKSEHYFVTIAEKFIEQAEAATWIVGQNIYYDTSVFKANVRRIWGEGSAMDTRAINALDKTKRLDIMRMSMQLQRGDGKKLGWKGLEEIYRHLFQTGYQAHTADGDVSAMVRVFETLKERQLIKNPYMENFKPR